MQLRRLHVVNLSFVISASAAFPSQPEPDIRTASCFTHVILRVPAANLLEMNAYHYVQQPHHIPSSSDFTTMHNAPSVGFQSDLNTSQHTSYVGQYRPVSQHHRCQLVNHFDSSTTVDGPDPDFALSLRSIRAAHPGSNQIGLDGASDSANPEALVAETILRSRKSWKTVKGRAEPVWPPELEKALIQALLQYRPNDPQFARALGRFPKRNRYISDYIFNATGVRRTPKQVGSRLQQLKDTPDGKMLLKHVANWSHESSPPVSATGSPQYHDLSPKSPAQLDVSATDMQTLFPPSELPDSPATSAAETHQSSYLFPISAPSAELVHPSVTHVQNMYPQGHWIPVDQSFPASY